MEILHHGAADGVTGSCHQLRLDTGFSLLVDCGLFQGADTSPGRAGAGSLDIEFDLAGIRALVATHVHIDHVGRIPYLLAAGFSGPILCSEPSARLLPIVLEDAFRLGISRDQHKVEQYLALVERRLIALPYNRWFTLSDTSSLRARIRLRRAGHILGSAYVEVDIRRPGQARRRVLFSGDLGAPHAPLLRPPQVAAGADVVVLESTYGDRQHEDRMQRRQRLKRLIEKALADDGSVLIPAFSIGRTRSCSTSWNRSSSRPMPGPALRLVPAGGSCRSSSTRRWPVASPRHTASCARSGMTKRRVGCARGAIRWHSTSCSPSTATTSI